MALARGQITITDLNDGADGIQANLYGYDSTLTFIPDDSATGCITHTQSGLTSWITGVGTVRVGGVVSEQGVYSISGKLYSIYASTVAISVCGVGEQVISLKAKTTTPFAFKIEQNTQTVDDTCDYVDFHITELGSSSIFRLYSLKIEHSDSLVGTSTDYDGLAQDTRPQGQNLFLNTDFAKKDNWSTFAGDVIENMYQGVTGMTYTHTFSSASSYSSLLLQHLTGKLEPSTFYTLSYWCKVDVETTILRAELSAKISDTTAVVLYDNSSSHATASALTYNFSNTEWKRHTIVFRTASELPSSYYIRFRSATTVEGSEATVQICMIKLEVGDKATDWCMNEADHEGKSAYEIAVDNGYTGTEAEWLESLIGSEGKSVKSVKEEYAIGNSSTSYADSTLKTGWTTTIQTPTADYPYLWNRETSYYDTAQTDAIATTTPVIVGNYSADGRGISSVEEQYLAFATEQSSITDSGYDTISETGFSQSKPYLYNRERIKYNDNTYGGWDSWQLISYYGQDGVSALIADFVDEIQSVPCNSSGTPTSTTAKSYVAHLYYGATQVEITSATCTVNGTSITPTISSDNKSATVSITPSSSYPDECSIVMELSCSYGTVSTYGKLVKVKAGTNGTSPTIYNLVPSVSAVKRNSSGTPNVTSVSCTVTKQVGSGTPTTTTDKTVFVGVNGGTPSSGSSHTIVSTDTSIEFYIYSTNKTTGVLLDKESIPIISDGADGQPGNNGADAIFLKLDNESDIMLYDSDGTKVTSSVTTTATLYKGGTAITSGVTWPTSYASGCTRTQSSGKITVSKLSANDAYVIVYAKYNDVQYTAKFTIKKLVGTEKYELMVSPTAIGYNISQDVYTANAINVNVYCTKSNARSLLTTLPSGVGLRCVTTDASGTTATTTMTYSSGASMTVAANIVMWTFELYDTSSTTSSEATIYDTQSTTLAYVSDGSPGADGVQPNLYGYDTEIGCGGIASTTSLVHTPTGVAVYATKTSTTTSASYCIFRIYVPLTANVVYAISGKVTASFSIGTTYTLYSYNSSGSRTAGGTGTFNSDGTFTWKMSSDVDSAYFVISIPTASGSTTFSQGYVDISNLKVEVVKSSTGTGTAFVDLAEDSIPQNANIIIDSQFKLSSNFDTLIGTKKSDIYRGASGIASPALTIYIGTSNGQGVEPSSWSTSSSSLTSLGYVWVRFSDGTYIDRRICLGAVSSGTSLYRSNLQFLNDSNTYTLSQVTDSGYPFFKVKYSSVSTSYGVSFDIVCQDITDKLKTDTWYTLSYWHKSSMSEGTIDSYVYSTIQSSYPLSGTAGIDIVDGAARLSYADNNHRITSSDSMGVWKRHTVTFKTASTFGTGYTHQLLFRVNDVASHSICMPKLEECQKATEWCVNEADKVGSAIRPRGEWNAECKDYVNNAEYRDVVIYTDNVHYIVAKGVSTVPVGTLPTNTTYWEKASEMQFVATDLLLANKAYIDNLGVKYVKANALIKPAEEAGYTIVTEISIDFDSSTGEPMLTNKIADQVVAQIKGGIVTAQTVKSTALITETCSCQSISIDGKTLKFNQDGTVTWSS